MKRERRLRARPVTPEEKFMRRINRRDRRHDTSPAARRRYHERVRIVISTDETKALAATLASAVTDAKSATPRDVAQVALALRLAGFVEFDIQAGFAAVGLRVGLDEIDEILLAHGRFQDARYYLTDKGNLTLAAEPGAHSCSDTWTAGFWMAYGKK